MNKRELARYSFMKSIPILCSYLFVSMAYGILMEESGFESDGIHRRFSVCAHFSSVRRRLRHYDRADSLFHEQQANLLQPDLCRRFQSHGKEKALYDSHHDR